MKIFKLRFTYIIYRGVIISQKIIHHKSITKICSTLLILFILTSGTYQVNGNESIAQSNSDSKISYHSKLEIEPGDDFCLYFNTDIFQFQEITDTSSLMDISEQVKRAIVKSPRWLHPDLKRQFQTLSDTQDYTRLILDANKTMTDEIAFCIAYSPLGDIPTPEIILENVNWLYHIDSFLDYADIIDIQEQNGNYYSTINYQILDNGKQKTIMLPSEIYYWGIVHPRLSGENVEPVYQTFWREFLFMHNDRGYPMIKELIQNITVLWDNESYNQGNQRIWTESITQHPTAIEAVSYWIGKTVPFLAIGDRPIQPNHIAHQHNGYCGELQTLAVAAQRTLLIPSRGANNIGEDHVWREFYHDEWHQADNWWADAGGCIDTPWVYTDGWGKEMSAIFSEFGDGTITDVTGRYLHKDETITVNLTVTDPFLQPYDNARISVLVKGLKDITWYQHQVLSFLKDFWKPYEHRLNGTIIETIYQRILEKISDLPEVIDTNLITTWNYTDVNGKCQFTLGKYDEYVFLIQSPSTTLPWPLSKHTAIRRLSTHNSKDYQIILPDLSRKPMIHSSKQSQGPYEATVSYQATWNIIHKNIKNNNIGIRKTIDELQIFFMDEENFQRYQQGKSFMILNPRFVDSGITTVDFTQDIYMVIPNNSLHTTVNVDFGLTISGVYDEDYVNIDRPRSALFPHAVFSVGDLIELSGTVHQPSQLIINDKTIQLEKGEWNLKWNTTGLMEGLYEITIQSELSSDHRTIELMDETPPYMRISTPVRNQVYQQSDIMTCSGYVYDNSMISSIMFSIDNSKQKTEYPDTSHWNTSLQLDDLSSGIHHIRITAIDVNGNVQNESITFYISDSNSSASPQILNNSYELKTQGEWTKITIYADSQSISEFPIDQLKVLYRLNEKEYEKPMFLYASHPVIDRHSEDPYVNQSNTPIYGCFLGDFQSGDSISYWIEVIDVLGYTNSTLPITIDI